MALEGLPLLDTCDAVNGIPTPVELMETVLHAMIGHFNLFLGGVLHGDVSPGNIVRLRQPIMRSFGLFIRFLYIIPDDSIPNNSLDLCLCRGFLIDGDHAIEWRKRRGTASVSPLERSATLPFMAKRLVMAYTKETPVLPTAVDDLESFVWVLVWTLVYISQSVTTISMHSNTYVLIGVFSSLDTTRLVSRDSWVKEERKNMVFGDLIRDDADAQGILDEGLPKVHSNWISISSNHQEVF
ncbi:hypothetical protein EI94DRAFT_1747628 [Lactarius quietus]|nr:hypothetical protein EI94DRAFT_1747628 [Lactarius quietus]